MIPTQREQRIQRLRKTIDYLAYGSLVLDICIAVLTLLSLLQLFDSQYVLLPVNYLLTIVVIVSLASASLLVYLKHEEKLLGNALRLSNHIRERFDRLKNPRYKYEHKSKRRFFDFILEKFRR
jgi:magnesium-transporting ATPase (P-type)